MTQAAGAQELKSSTPAARREAGRPRRSVVAHGLAFVLLAALGLVFEAYLSTAEGSEERDSAPPSLWDPARRLEKPDLANIRRLRFVTEDDYPPFNFALPSGDIVGFNVDFARALCVELEIPCTIQRRQWEFLIGSLNDDSADVVIASLARTPENSSLVDFTEPYYLTPGRFVTLKESVLSDATPRTLTDRSVAVVQGSAHQAYLKAFFPNANLVTFENAALARRALRSGRVNALFGDAISLSFWLNGADADGCCVFKGGPYLDQRYFGDGIGMAVKKGSTQLRRALQYAMWRVAQRGVYSELYLKYFPVSPF
ncbi:MAG TPA: transporter substrate-binding domain-containing protein [Methylocystis sp.]|nr:transporter substrate-binding domain-containing protein [Methylocystis sp.]